MTQVVSKPAIGVSPVGMGYLYLGLAGIIWGLMALGSATRVMEAGLACPDWPLCFGEVIPAAQMDLQVFLEWFHRLVASGVGVFTLVLAGLAWWGRSSLPRWLPWASGGAVLLVLWQGVLGGLTVTQLLQFEIVTAHLGTGLLFFAYVLTVALILLHPQPGRSWSVRATVGLVATLLVYGQSLLGAVVASRWALHQCMDSQELCGVVSNHLWGIIPASLGVLVAVVASWYRWPKLSYGMLGLWLGQLVVGYSTYKLQLAVPAVTVMHQAIGALLLGSLVVFTTLAVLDRPVVSAQG